MLKSQLPMNEHYAGLYSVMQNIPYCHDSKGPEQTLDLIVPWQVSLEDPTDKTYPLIVFVQGSGWQLADNGFEVVQLAEMAKKGYIVAMVRHRNAFKNNPFPDYLMDVKCAIRFLRANAKKYCINPEQVIGLGTSSGGNAVQLVGLTADDPQYETSDYSDFSDKVDVVISCFGVSNVVAIKDQAEFVEVTQKLENSRYSNTLEQMSPFFQVRPGRNYPPFLLMHGSEDTLVPYNQMPEMALRLDSDGYEVETVTVVGADHESNFWSQQVWDKILNFITTHLPVKQ
ncbi:alpha/beta hydrolase [Levilactobacillus namurensis]|uniref:alpha/beta hydrolase n=1 Tax=Levilactobacillus namurensis TaxID=380393 RepID=UPI0026EAA442|nr:alpha/beta hydrolase [Levilactobacillus namurensis]